MATKKVTSNKKEPQKPSFVPFEDEHQIRAMKLFFIIVPYGQANSIITRLNEFDVACNFIFNGEGIAKNYVDNYHGVMDSKKQIILTIIREDKVEFVKRKLEERFALSRASRGFAFSIKITSVAGVSIYKFLTNSRKVQKVKKNGSSK